MKLNSFLTLCLGTALSVASSFAVTPTIGVVSAVGEVEVNSALIYGNANLFEGSRVKTSEASSQVLLQSGTAVTLATKSSATVYKDHMQLEQGGAKADKMNGYSIRAATYRIEGAEPGSEAVVRLSDGSLQVAALSGSLNIFDGKGSLLTRIGAGTASAFQAGGGNSGQSGATTVSGVSRKVKLIELYTILGASVIGLGLSTDAILQPVSP